MATGNWILGKDDIEIFSLGNREITLRNVPVKVNKERNIKMVDIDDVIRLETEFIAKENNIEPKQLPILCLLYAKLPFDIKGNGIKVAQGEIKQITRFHKMLFEVWQETITVGYDKLYPSHDFYPDVYGPVSKDFKPQVESLEKKGLVKVNWAKKNGESSIFTLTENGFKVAKELWAETPDDVKTVIENTKDKLALATAQEIIKHFHEKYPKYRRDRPTVAKMLEKYSQTEKEN